MVVSHACIRALHMLFNLCLSPVTTDLCGGAWQDRACPKARASVQPWVWECWEEADGCRGSPRWQGCPASQVQSLPALEMHRAQWNLLCPTASSKYSDLIWFDLGSSLGFSYLSIFIKRVCTVLLLQRLLMVCKSWWFSFQEFCKLVVTPCKLSNSTTPPPDPAISC